MIRARESCTNVVWLSEKVYYLWSQIIFDGNGVLDEIYHYASYQGIVAGVPNAYILKGDLLMTKTSAQNIQ